MEDKTMENMNFLELVDHYMDQGYDEDLACRMAAYDLHPETYDANDYDTPDDYCSDYYGDYEE